MSAADLKEHGAEGEGNPAAQPKPEAAPAAEPLPSAVASPEIAGMLTMATAIIGNGLCERFQVQPMSDGEAGMIGQAGAGVIAEYGLNANPKALAWLTLMGAVTAVGWPRYQAYRGRKAAELEASRQAGKGPGETEAAAAESQPVETPASTPKPAGKSTTRRKAPAKS